MFLLWVYRVLNQNGDPLEWVNHVFAIGLFDRMQTISL